MSLDLLLLLALFVVLGISADLVVRNIKYIATVLKIRLFAFGILLGLITSLPELAIGINATIDRAPALAVGNMLSGIIVILGLVLGVSLLLNRHIVTDGRWSVLLPQTAIIFFPILLGWDGTYSLVDGVIMSGSYLALIFYLYHVNRPGRLLPSRKINQRKITRALFMSIVGIVLLILSSNWIIDITLDLLKQVNISQLMVGVLIFAIGTNLPEITIAITAWRKKTSELSLSHLLSSAFTNVLFLGILAIIRPITFNVSMTFWVLSFFVGLITIVFLLFYHSGKKMDRREGFWLLAIYIIFVMINWQLMNN